MGLGSRVSKLSLQFRITLCSDVVSVQGHDPTESVYQGYLRRLDFLDAGRLIEEKKRLQLWVVAHLIRQFNTQNFWGEQYRVPNQYTNPRYTAVVASVEHRKYQTISFVLRTWKHGYNRSRQYEQGYDGLGILVRSRVLIYIKF